VRFTSSVLSTVKDDKAYDTSESFARNFQMCHRLNEYSVTIDSDGLKLYENLKPGTLLRPLHSRRMFSERATS